MRIIVSPAKKMRVDTDCFDCRELPVFLDRTETLMNWIKGLSYKEQKKLWACSGKIAQENAERFAEMDLQKNLTPAIIAYDGIQYTYMAPSVFEYSQFDYVQEHLRILSGFYGVLKPMDGVVPYRLEMQAPFVFLKDILELLRQDEDVWKNYQRFSEPYQRIRIAYIEAARKRPEEF